MNLCTTCNLDFGSLGAFDAHRKGDYANIRSTEHPEGRYCLTAGELRDLGWAQDNHGRWRRPFSEDASLRFAQLRWAAGTGRVRVEPIPKVRTAQGAEVI